MTRTLYFPTLLVMALINACSQQPEVHFFPAGEYPDQLSAWGIVEKQGDDLVFAARAEPYELNTSLFSDYALKLRTVWLPPGTSSTFNAIDAFEFPAGTIVTKSFFYPKVKRGDEITLVANDSSIDVQTINFDDFEIIETRLLVRQADHWDALPYVWQGDDAHLKIAGTIRQFTIEIDGQNDHLNYIVPTRNECAACHATNHSTGDIQPIGLKARHLNRAYPGEVSNQLTRWQSDNLLSGLPPLADVPVNARLDDTEVPIDRRARAYLDINCGHCHNTVGAADTSGLNLDASTTSLRQLGYCKAPIAAGRGSGGRAYSIVPGQPDASILIYRLEITDPGSLMPELGRTLVHTEGVALLRQWISEIPGACT